MRSIETTKKIVYIFYKKLEPCRKIVSTFAKKNQYDYVSSMQWVLDVEKKRKKTPNGGNKNASVFNGVSTDDIYTHPE
jgi:hypothetical protein